MSLTRRQKWTILLIETGVLVLAATWLLSGIGRLAEPSAWLLALVLIALGDLATALIMQRIAPTRVLLAPGEAGRHSAAVLRGFEQSNVGVIRVRGEIWRARSRDSQLLQPGDPVHILSRDGLVLEVEPARGAGE